MTFVPPLPPPPTMAEARRFRPQQRIVHIITPSNQSWDPTPASVSPLNGPPKTVQSVRLPAFIFALSSSEGLPKRQLRMTIANTIRKLRMICLDRSMANGVDEPITPRDFVFDLLASCNGRLAWGRKRQFFRHGVWSESGVKGGQSAEFISAILAILIPYLLYVS